MEQAVWSRCQSADEMEKDNLDFTFHFDPRHSRLSCQLRVTADFDGLSIKVS